MTRRHVKQTYRLDARLVALVAERALQRGVTRTEVVEAALAAMLAPAEEDGREALLTRRLDRLSRQADRLEWHIELSNEALGLFVRSWLTNTAPLPNTALAAAQATGRKRWQAFVESLSRKLELGPRLRDELAEGPGSGAAGR